MALARPDAAARQWSVDRSDAAGPAARRAFAPRAGGGPGTIRERRCCQRQLVGGPLSPPPRHARPRADEVQLTRLTPDQVRQIFEPVLLREARGQLDSLIEI